jgi:hypothetical protein
MGWKDWLGLSPSREGFARKLVQLAHERGASGWRYDPADAALTNTEDTRKFFVDNSWLEYSRAPRATRSALLEKYLHLIVGSEDEVPKLWSVAANHIYGCLRSRHQLVSLEIDSRGTPGGVPKPLSKPWHGDLDIVLMYDFGQHMTGVTPDTADPWGQAHDAIFDRARANLAALERPSWEELGDRVFQIASDVTFEESFVLVNAVWKSLPVQGDPVVAIPNRGVLFATGADNAAGLSRLIAEAQRSMQERPWALSATLLRRSGDTWQPFVPDAELACAAHTFELVSLAITYSGQQKALEKYFERENVDVYVAKFDFMRTGGSVDNIESWCSWTEGVESLLPQTDVVVLGRSVEGIPARIVRWPDVVRICGHHLQATQEDPPRFRVRSFPLEEWPLLEAAGRELNVG